MQEAIMKKGFWLMSVILALALLFLLPLPFVNAAASFKVSDLNISPTFISAGSGGGTITISAKVANTSTETGTYKAELKINNAIEATKELTLESGKDQTVIFPVAKTEVGEYNVSIGDLKGVFSIAPAGLEVKTLLINPLETSPGKEVVVSVTVLNKSSDQPLTYDSLKLFIDGTVADKKRIELKGGESTTLSFTVSKSEARNYVVQIGPKTGSFTVKASIFSSLPTFVWAIIGAVVLVIIIMVVMVLTAPKKKKTSMTGRPGKAARGQSPPMQPVAVQPPFGQPMSPYSHASEQMSPYPGQMQSPQAMPQYPGQQPQTTSRPPFPGQPPQMPQQPFSQQSQMPPQPFAPQQAPPYPGQMQHPPPQTTSPFPRQTQPMPPYPGQMQSPQAMPQQPFGQQQQMPSVRPEQFGTPFASPAHPGFAPPPFGMPGRLIPQFTVSNLNITPQNVKEGDGVNISAVVTNNSAAVGQYSMVLRIGGVVENISEMTLNPGSSQTALFTIIKDTPGEYYVEVDGQRGMFTVIHRLPAAFSVSNLNITPDRVKQGEPITISAIISNSGETPGSYSVVLRIKGIAESIEEVELGPSRSQKVVFTITKDTAGFYPVALENLSGRFVVEMDWKG